MVLITELEKEDLAKLIFFINNVRADKLKDVISKGVEENINVCRAALIKIINAYRHIKQITQQDLDLAKSTLRGIILGKEDDELFPFITSTISILDKIEIINVQVGDIKKLGKNHARRINLFLEKIQPFQDSTEAKLQTAVKLAYKNLDRIMKAYDCINLDKHKGPKDFQAFYSLNTTIVLKARRGLLEIVPLIKDDRLIDEIQIVLGILGRLTDS